MGERLVASNAIYVHCRTPTLRNSLPIRAQARVMLPKKEQVRTIRTQRDAQDGNARGTRPRSDPVEQKLQIHSGFEMIHIHGRVRTDL